MKTYSSPALSMSLDASGCIVDLRVPGGPNLIRSPRDFAQVAYFDLQPAFTNEWVHPLCIEEPDYASLSGLTWTDEGFTLHFTYGANTADLIFAVGSRPEALIIELRDVVCTGVRPARIRFALMCLDTDASSAATGLALDPIIEGASLPGVYMEQYAQVYDRLGYAGRRWAVTAADKAALRERLQDIVHKYTVDIPWMTCSGPFAKDVRKVQGSYMMVYGAYLPGSLTPQNLEKWIGMLHAIGLTQVDFHGAEGKNFTFGDFEPNRDIYPEGRKSLKAVVDRLHEEGIDSILHTYSALISDNSSLVKPVPDPRLGYNRVFTLTADVDETATELPIAEDTAEISLVHTGHYNSSTYVIWDDEIIQFTALGERSLKGCIRGAYGTRAAAHKAGTEGRNLKRKYNIFAPDVGGPLFDHVARQTAACANECGFDGYYFDALEGVHVLEGTDLEDYWCTRFVYDVARYTGRPIGMEMSTMHHNLWFVRSRLGAWDRPSRAHKRFLERHAEVNARAQARSLVPQNLGWWYLGANLPSAPSRWERITTDVYETMGRLAAAYDFSLSFQGLTVQDYDASEEIRRYGDRIRRWEALRLSGTLTEPEREALRRAECHMEPEGIYEAAYPQAEAKIQNGEAALTLLNPYGAQTPFLMRIEPLSARAAEAAQAKKVFDVNEMVDPGVVQAGADSASAASEFSPMGGITSDDLLIFNSRTVTGGVDDVDTPYGPGFALTARAARDLGVIRFERRFSEAVNIDGQYGCGVWVHGDGKGEVLNLQMRSHKLYSDGLDEKLIVIDFVGWKYFELIESSSRDTMGYLWPYYHRQLDTDGEFLPLIYEPETSDWSDSMYDRSTFAEGNPHHLTASIPDFTRIAFAAMWLNNLPAGEECRVRVAGWHTFFTKPCTLADICVEAPDGSRVTVSGVMTPDSIAEFSDVVGSPVLGEARPSAPSWYTSDAHSAVTTDFAPSGTLRLAPGSNLLRIRADAPDGARVRVVCGVKAEAPIVRR